MSSLLRSVSGRTKLCNFLAQRANLRMQRPQDVMLHAALVGFHPVLNPHRGDGSGDEGGHGNGQKQHGRRELVDGRG